MSEALDANSVLTTLARRVLAWVPIDGAVDWASQTAAGWQESRWGSTLVSHSELDPIALDDLLAVDDQKQALVDNTEQFLHGYPANNVLLWGARGTGKSSLIHALLNRYADRGLRLVEVNKSALRDLPRIASLLGREPYRFILFCDDLSFDAEDASYKELKSALEGSMFRGSSNLLIYATSNRRHLLPEYASDNQHTKIEDGELHESEAVEEKISLSDRFGLWLSFYPLKQDDYLKVTAHWLSRLGDQHGLQQVAGDQGALPEPVRLAALAWARARGVRSGRTAQYFARHWVGQMLIKGEVNQRT
ncbi:MAG: ATP-binding protein [Pseudomonadales bacterium]